MTSPTNPAAALAYRRTRRKMTCPECNAIFRGLKIQKFCSTQCKNKDSARNRALRKAP